MPSGDYAVVVNIMSDIGEEEGMVRPKYDSYCLSNVPSTLLSILNVDMGRPRLPRDVFDGVDTAGIENIVLFLFDGLGQNEWERQSRTREGLFGRVSGHGRVTPITTVFPSTTSTALTTLATGLTPQEHGLIEWFLYLKDIDMIVQSLPFSPMGGRGSDGLLSKLGPEVLFEGETIFSRLARADVAAHSYLSKYIAHSAYSGMVHAASEVQPYTSSSDLAVMLRRKLEAQTGPSFHYVYWSSIDTLEHLYGPDSEEAYIEARNVSAAFEEGLLRKMDHRTASKTLFVLTADHGHVYSPTTDTLWLDRYHELVESFAVGWSGRPMYPWGAPRDVYLQIREERLDEVRTYLSRALDGTALVVKTSDAIASGIFGSGVPTQRFQERVGNLMVLPREKRSVWYHHPGVEALSLIGQHGGMHHDEMTIPLAVARASSLVG